MVVYAKGRYGRYRLWSQMEVDWKPKPCHLLIIYDLYDFIFLSLEFFIPKSVVIIATLGRAI